MKQPFTFTWKQIIYGLGIIGAILLALGIIISISAKTIWGKAQVEVLMFGGGFLILANGLYLKKGDNDYYKLQFLGAGIGLIIAAFIGLFS